MKADIVSQTHARALDACGVEDECTMVGEKGSHSAPRAVEVAPCSQLPSTGAHIPLV